nr:hypothetical protein [Tanacetum cinerariifolium]
MTESPLMDLGFVVHVFSPRDDLIATQPMTDSLLTAVASSWFPSTSNHLRTSFNLRNHATIQDDRVRVQQVQGRQGEGHMARQCTQPKRPRNAAWYKEKAMLAEAQESGQILDEEQLTFLVDSGVPYGQAIQTIILNNAAFQNEDLDTYDSDCDDISNAKVVLMANISNYDSDVILEVPNSKTCFNDMENQGVHAMQDFEQPPVMDFTDNEIHSGSNIIPYSQYLQETRQENVQDTNLQAQQDLMILSVIEQMSKQMINHIKPTLYDGIVIYNKHVAMHVIDDEETLILEDESRSKMSKKEKDLEAVKQKISNKPIDYVKLNKLYEDFGKSFVPQQEFSADEAVWYHMVNPSTKSFDALPVKIEAPKELSKLHAYLEQHELYANEFRLLRKINQDTLAFVANQQMTPLHFNTYQSSYNNPQLQQQTSFNLRNHATIQDDRVRVQQVQGRQGEGHMARQCTQPKRPRNAAWYKEKAMLAKAQESGQILDEEQLTFLVDSGVQDGQAIQTIILNNAAFQNQDLDTYDSDCDDISNAKAVLMANISNYDSDIILEIKQTLYDGIVIYNKHVAMHVIDDEETLILEEESRSKMSEKDKDPEAVKQKVSNKPIDYVKLNKLYEDFGKSFVPQQEFSTDEAV